MFIGSHYTQTLISISIFNLPAHECIRDILLHLNGKDDERHEDHDDHQELWGPDLRGDVTKAHRGEGDHAEVERVEQGQVVACSFEVLDTADADGGWRGRKDGENRRRKKEHWGER